MITMKSLTTQTQLNLVSIYLTQMGMESTLTLKTPLAATLPLLELQTVLQIFG